MFRKLVSISLIICVLGSLLQFTIPVSWYITNYAHITTNLCINRDNPDIECNGMCQLKIQMDHHNDHEGHESQKTIERNYRINFFLPHETITFENSSKDHSGYILSDDRTKSLWISEPHSPPPQLG